MGQLVAYLCAYSPASYEWWIESLCLQNNVIQCRIIIHTLPPSGLVDIIYPHFIAFGAASYIRTFSGLESSMMREVMRDAKALGMSADTNSTRCLSPASPSSVEAHTSIPEAILKRTTPVRRVAVVD